MNKFKCLVCNYFMFIISGTYILEKINNTKQTINDIEKKTKKNTKTINDGTSNTDNNKQEYDLKKSLFEENINMLDGYIWDGNLV